jgi:hypothetical protein
MFTIGYDSSFNKSVQLEEGGGDNQNPPEASPGTTLDDIDALVNTNEYYKKWGQEQQVKTQVHQMCHKRVPQQKKKPKIIVKNKEGLPPEIQMMVEIKTLPKRQLKNHTLFMYL